MTIYTEYRRCKTCNIARVVATAIALAAIVIWILANEEDRTEFLWAFGALATAVVACGFVMLRWAQVPAEPTAGVDRARLAAGWLNYLAAQAGAFAVGTAALTAMVAARTDGVVSRDVWIIPGGLAAVAITAALSSRHIAGPGALRIRVVTGKPSVSVLVTGILMAGLGVWTATSAFPGVGVEPAALREAALSVVMLVLGTLMIAFGNWRGWRQATTEHPTGAGRGAE